MSWLWYDMTTVVDEVRLGETARSLTHVEGVFHFIAASVLGLKLFYSQSDLSPIQGFLQAQNVPKLRIFNNDFNSTFSTLTLRLQGGSISGSRYLHHR
jgi:hypothetical protein